MTDRQASLRREAWSGNQQALAEVYAQTARVHGVLGQSQGRARLAHFLSRSVESENGR